jgi:drug/metabolite transporter (DMT)-like permease
VTTEADMAERADERRVSNRLGAAFILADMTLVVTMTAIVKLAGSAFPAVQLVFLRASVGLILVLPLVWKYRSEVFDTQRIRGHLGRVLCNALALSCNFAALIALPLSLVTAIAFTRPFVVMGLAAAMLGERASLARWLASLVCFGGVLIMTNPGSMAWDLGLAAAFGSVLFGSLAVIQVRRLKGEHTVLLMLFYTLGLTALTAVPAGFVWVQPKGSDIPALVAIGLLAQLAQFWFLRAHQLAEIRALAPLGYLSIVLSMLADYAVFDLSPTWSAILGASVIVGSSLGAQFLDRRPVHS